MAKFTKKLHTISGNDNVFKKYNNIFFLNSCLYVTDGTTLLKQSISLYNFTDNEIVLLNNTVISRSLFNKIYNFNSVELDDKGSYFICKDKNNEICFKFDINKNIFNIDFDKVILKHIESVDGKNSFKVDTNKLNNICKCMFGTPKITINKNSLILTTEYDEIGIISTINNQD